MSARRPPRWARAVAELLVRGPEHEFILGDLEQMFAARADHSGPRRATGAYLTWVARSAARSLPPHLLAGLAGDVRLGARQFRRAPRVHVGAALVLAAGLGVATFAWGIYYAEQLRTLPVEGADRLVEVGLWDRASGSVRSALSIADYELLRGRREIFGVMALTGGGAVQLNDQAAPAEQIDAVLVSPSMFGLLEMRPALGRLFVEADAAPGATAVAVLGHDFWRDRYASASDIVGTTIRIDGEPTVVVGVLPEGARYLGADPLWLPIGARGDRDALDWTGVAMVVDGVATTRVEQELASLSEGIASERPDLRASAAYALLPFGYSMRGPHTATGTRVLAWVGVLLYLMAVANVANLFLVRARRRARELALRRAIGAGVGRILRQLGVEASGPALLGMVGGALLAGAGLSWYRQAATVYGGGTPGPVWVHYGLEGPHFLVLAVGALASTVLVSLAAAAWELGRREVGVLHAKPATAGGFGLGKALLAGEIAAGGALLLLATLLLKGAWNLRTIDYGFATEPVVTGAVELGAAYPDAESRLAFFRRLEAELAELPGAERVALATQLPMIRYRGLHHIEVEGWDWDGSDVRALPRRYADFVTPGFFDTFERALLDGRGFTSGDDREGEPVALVNQPFAERYLAGGAPIGRRVRIWRGDEPGPWRRIVGIAPHLWMDTDVNAIPEGIYVPMAQAPAQWAQIAVRVRGNAADFGPPLRRAVARLDPDLPLLDLQTMPELIRMRTRSYRFQSPPFIAVGVAALLLALGGLYAVVSYLASLRAMEFGIRASVGASRPGLVRLALTGVWWPTLLGILGGVACGMYLVRGFDRWLFLVEPWSPSAIGLSAGVLAVGAFASALAPALRASRVDLASILKAE